MSGRFDLPVPDGTCYLAETLAGAFVEVFQRWIAQRIPVPRSEIETRQGSYLLAPHRMHLADCTNPRALAFGVTGEMHGTPDRRLTQAWAAAFHAAGFGGVRYLVRTSPSMRLVGIALFHQSGEAAWPIASRQPIAATLLDEIEREFGVQVR